ncbi:MAG: flavodoxin family protein [Acidobacteriota bacterium]
MSAIIYASMSGNSEFVAEEVQRRIDGSELIHADGLTPERLATLGRVVAVIPTWGRGEIPADAERIAQALEGCGEDALAALEFALIAPGDRTYPDFCGGGLRFASLLKAHGARELQPPLTLDGIPMERHLDDIDAWLAALPQSVEN